MELEQKKKGVLMRTMTMPCEPIDNDAEQHKNTHSVQEEPLEPLIPKYLLPGQDEHPSAETFEAALPILWSFLLEPGRIKDPSSQETFVNFKSIASLLFVNSQAKEAFDACNGRVMCVRAWKKEAAAREGYIRKNLTRIKAYFLQPRMVPEWYQRRKAVVQLTQE